jgi:serine/threonine-protein kinase HipA
MNRCPIIYEPCPGKYSNRGLKLLSRQLTDLQELPYSASELRQEAAIRAGKMSIQGVQPKLSALLNIKQQKFEIVDLGGKFILKPPLIDYPQVPENEDLTMRLAARIGIEVPLHGLIYGKDGALTYFIKRYDRSGRHNTYHVEDFAQLAGQQRDTKYHSSMEQIARLVETYCTFPAVEKLKLFRQTLFSFLIGNEDMHLKNFSIIRKNDMVTLAPAYDLLNTTMILLHPEEELALPLNGKKNRIKRNDLVDYFGSERLGLSKGAVNHVLETISQARNDWDSMLDISFLSLEMKEQYRRILNERFVRLFEES